MIIFQNAADLRRYAHQRDEEWVTAGFVPTMGALHHGHLSLVEKAREKCSPVIASIFVNPTQFNNKKDFEKYPSTISKDIQMLEEAGCDILFLPDADEIYPDGSELKTKYDLGSLENVLEGYYRPGHFQGVCQVVHILLNIVEPSTIFMGQKDFQQCMVVQRLIETKNLGVRLVTCPTLREADGLAMSSRNMRLTADQRKKASAIYTEMVRIKENLKHLPPLDLEVKAAENLLRGGFEKVDYVSIAEPATLEPLISNDKAGEAVVLVAAHLGEIRLIDNLVLTGKGILTN